MDRKKMFILKEPRERGGKKGESKTFWNRIGVMFSNKTSEDGKESFDLLFDAHPIGDKVKAFTVDPKAEGEAVTGS